MRWPFPQPTLRSDSAASPVAVRIEGWGGAFKRTMTWRARSACALLLAVALVGSVLFSVPAPAQAPPATVGAAGDIACDPGSSFFNGGAGDATHCRQTDTSDLLSSGFDAVLALGDTQYEDGALAKFQASYGPSWGRVRSITRPVIGNHEYQAGQGGAGYFDYFNGPGAATGPAGDRGSGYYSFDLGGWHLIALNSMCTPVGGCGAGSPQEQWLREDLFAHATSCTLAYWHHPLFSSGGIGDNTAMRPIWRALYEGGAEVVLNGHDHDYERFAPQDPGGVADPAYGLREFVVGTGGKSLLALGAPKPNSEVRQDTTFGILALALRGEGYDWRFIPEAGGSFSDSGSASCHGGPPGAYPSASSGVATAVTDTTAVLNGTVNPKNQPTAYRFEYGRTARYGSSTLAQRVGASVPRDQLVSAQLTRLRGGRTLHYRVVATSAAGTTAGPDRTFATFARRGRYARAVLGTFGIAAYWRLGEARGPRAVDETGAYPGSYRGRYRLRRRGVVGADGNTAAAFGGRRGEVVAPGPALSRVGSLEGWFHWQDGTALMRDGTASGTAGWILAYDRGGRLAYRVGGRSFTTRRTTASLRDGWHHFVVTKQGRRAALYLDGRRLHSSTRAGSKAPRLPWHLMRNGRRSRYARGRADEVALYTVALPPRTVRRHYRLTKAR